MVPRSFSFITGDQTVEAATTVERFSGVDTRRYLINRGDVPSSGPHPNSDRGKLDKIFVDDPLELDKESTLHTTVWQEVSSFREIKDRKIEIVTAPEEVAGEADHLVESKIRDIKRRYPDYYEATEVIVYPVHKARTYPVSEADAFMQMFLDNSRKSTDVMDRMEIGVMDPSGSHTRNLPYQWSVTSGESVFPWRTFPFPLKYGGYTFNSYSDVLDATDSQGKQPWLKSPDIWKTWGAEHLRPYVDFKSPVYNHLDWYGRGHPVLYDPGNDPYMDNMKYSDWDLYDVRYGMPDGSNMDFMYYHWFATRFENPETDYRIQVRFEKPKGPTADFSFDPAHPMVDENIQFTDLSKAEGAPIVKWEWAYRRYIGAIVDRIGTPMSTKQNPTQSFPEAIVYYVALTVTDANGYKDSVTKPVPITLDGKAPGGPKADFSFSEAIAKEPVSFTDLSTHPNNGTIVAWDWTFPDESTAEEQHPSYIFEEEGTYPVTLEVTDANGLTDIITKNVMVNPENIPPVAGVSVRSPFYWPETVTFQDASYDIDGYIISRQFLVEGQPSDFTRSFSRVTEPTTYSASIFVMDDDGDTDQAFTNFTVLPTKPTADISVTGSFKINRKIVADATNSDTKSPIHVAPIDYTKTDWQITPVTDGIDPSGIKIRPSNDYSTREFLVREPGQYRIQATVTNIFGETSDAVDQVINVINDEPPVASFSVNQSKVLRDQDGVATILLTDSSRSVDDDFISERTWYVEYDSDNDGVFGTLRDGQKQILSDENLETVTFKTDRVGHYRFSLYVKEGFGLPTLEEFIRDEHYLDDETDLIATPPALVTVDTYFDGQNFNKPEFEKAVEVDNAPPRVDFGMSRSNALDVVLNFSGLAEANYQENYTDYGDQERYYQGYYQETRQWESWYQYYTYNEDEMNYFTQLAGDLQVDFIKKGIDADITIDNSFVNDPDPDGTFHKNRPIWGTTSWYTYSDTSETSSSPYYSPPAGWYVVGTQDNTEYQSMTFTCSFSKGDYWCPNWSDYTSSLPSCYAISCSGWNTTFISHTYTSRSADEEDAARIAAGKPPISDDYFRVASTDMYSRTNVVSRTYYLQQSHYHEAEEIQRFETAGEAKPHINTNDFSESILNHDYRDHANKYYIRMDSDPWDWLNTGSKLNEVQAKKRAEDIYLWNVAVEENRDPFSTLIAGGSQRGQFNVYDFSAAEKQMKEISDYFVNNYAFVESGENLTILLGEEIDYDVVYTDHENDPEIKREWNFQHDPTKINGRVIDNQQSRIAQHNLWINEPIQLNRVGTYSIQLRSQDDPVHFNDERFANYRKWSDDEIVREYIVNVHRRPVANFTFNVDRTNQNSLSLNPSSSYDPEHETNRSDRGIATYDWSYYLDGDEYEGFPENLIDDKHYDVTLTVTDLDGATDSITKRISTTNENHRPVAYFNVQDTVLIDETLDFTDLSYDPDNDPLTKYEITIKKQGQKEVLKTLSTFPQSFASLNLPVGNYTIGLTVEDIPRVGEALRSHLYERNITVIKNNPPVSVFSLLSNGSTVVKTGEELEYIDSSYDPDDHPLISYSWKVELLGAGDQVQQEWITGVAPTDLQDFAGVGKYRITQTVFDLPPYPLPSLSGSSSTIVEMIQGPIHPYAQFKWLPLQPQAGETINLNSSPSYDPDGEIVGWEWVIQAPNGTTTNSNVQHPVIANAVEGTYTVSLHVYDNDGLRSVEPAIYDIKVKETPPNNPPTASFIWEPFRPFIGKEITFNPDASWDLDNDEIVEWNWEFKDDDGNYLTSADRYPKLLATSSRYEVTLIVRDEKGAYSEPATRVVNVDIAAIDPFVTHTEEWSNSWVEWGHDPDVNIFKAGEKFMIEVTTTPAVSVEGTVDFGGIVGLVDIPSYFFAPEITDTYEMVWRAELWREDFELIEDGEYVFNFKSTHSNGSLTETATGNYFINIDGRAAANFHRNY